MRMMGEKKSIALIIILLTIVVILFVVDIILHTIKVIKMRQLKKEIIYILMELDILKHRNWKIIKYQMW